MTTETRKPIVAVHIRWMIRNDWPEVQAIENSVFEFPWREDDFIRCLRIPANIGMVAVANGQIAGYMIYELHKHRLHILDFAVHEDCRYKGVGRQMVDKLKSKLSYDRRSRIMLEIRESNVDAQLFFRAMGFKCVSTLRSFYEDTPEDAYLMQYRFNTEPTP